MGWIELFLNYARVGLAQPLDLEFLLPAPGPERQRLMAEVDAVAQYHYRLKVAHEEKIRRRFRQEAAGEEEAALLDSVMASLSLDETALGDAVEADEDNEDDDEDDDEEDYQEELEVAGFSGGASQIQGAIHGRGQLVTPIDEKRSPFLIQKEDEKERRGSGSGGRSGIFGRKHHHHHDGESQQQQPTAQAPMHVHPPTQPHPPRPPKHIRKQEKRVKELMVHPSTDAIAELRPLFVEMVSFAKRWRSQLWVGNPLTWQLQPMLKVRPIQ